MRAVLAAAVTLCAAAPWAAAQELSLSLPLDCELGETCYIQQYVDHDPGPGAQDSFCGPLTYDSHKGTDFAVRTLRDMEAGVDVLAAADGRVLGLRDGMADVLFKRENAESIAGRGCGNGVVLDHGNGWQTQYCHLRNGTVQVAKGDVIKRGTVLGQVGLSGRTQFPHLHLSVRKDAAVVDPFVPDGARTCGAVPTDTMWDTPIPVQMGGIIDVGFASAVPEFSDIKAGTAKAEVLPTDTPALVAYGFVFGARAGDTLEITIDGPTETFVSQELSLERTQAQLFRAIGKRVRGKGLEAGLYLAEVSLIRDGKMIDRMKTSIPVE